MSTIDQSTWEVDQAHSGIEFSVRHLLVGTVRGMFTLTSGTIVNGNGETWVEAVVDVSSINTGNHMRDNHLKSADFFDVTEHPSAGFSATLPTPSETTRDTTAQGALTLKGITHSVKLTVTRIEQGLNMNGEDMVAVEAIALINRRDFGIDFDLPLPSGIKAIGDTIELRIDLETARQK
ncbi:YceI family protein [Mycobacteroides abscessus]